MKRRVSFFPGSTSVEVDDGATVLDAAVAAGVPVNSVCGGKGTCGKCVVIVDGPTAMTGKGNLSDEEVGLGYRLACLTEVKGDLTVFVPEGSQVREQQIMTTYRKEEAGKLSPLAERRMADMPAPSLDDSTADLERFLNALGVPDLEVPLPLLKRLPRTLRDSGWRVSALIGRTDRGRRLMDVRSAAQSPKEYGIAVDIGTTTVVAELVDLSTGDPVAQSSDYNRQIVAGEDVLSRIAFAEEKGAGRLTELVLDTINGLVGQLCEERDEKRRYHSGICGDDIVAVSVGGNTVMTHLFLGLDPKNIRYEPYIPTAGIPPITRAQEVGLRVHPEAPVYCVPGRASYVGGDITADVLLSGLHAKDELAMLIDVGTNGEVVLGDRDWMVCCSTSAGPAFEGGEVSCGMRAMTGAIDSVSIKDYDIDITTIRKTPPAGICGSGLIDLIAQMFLAGFVDKKGRIAASGSERVRSSGRGMEFVVHPGQGGKKDIFVTDDDISNVIRTKAAIYAGCSVLLQSVGKSFDDVERLYIAGGFGNYINVPNAQAIGLLPDVPKEKFEFLGNASLGGAELCLLSEDRRAEARSIYDRMTYLDLSSSSAFFDQYSSALFLPHTDLERFPRVRERMRA
ncbi:ASKHA domain-containing protein [Methanomassiliicoccus luminyensis]|uniref:ASKHA domain-containing protein n=1 Tax=Methanomassiliicoccus luminyensis TaxID=1080712 RepID=UPI00036FB89C|nr:ASKHA domain-containing protein [Methanomassiliicoccus luminyensis]